MLQALCVGNRDVVTQVIVVVPAGDPTEPVVRALAKQAANLRVVATPVRLSAGAARNRGRVEAGSCEYLAFVDSDCVVEAGGVGRLLHALTRRPVALAAPRLMASEGGVVGWLRHLLEFKESDEAHSSADAWMVPSATMVCSAADFDRVEGFPDLWPGEDLVFCWRLRDRGAVFVPDVTVVHRHPPGLRAALGHQFRLGFTSAQARRMTGMAGTVFCRHLWLIPGLILGRWLRGVVWVLRFRPSEFARLLVAMPLYLGALMIWGVGFAYGSRAPVGRWIR